MHEDHGIFQRGVAQYRMIRLRFFDGEPVRELTSQCAPLYFSSGCAGKNESGCYYFWDFEADEGYNFIALSPGRIISMELTESAFGIEEISSLSKRADKST